MTMDGAVPPILVIPCFNEAERLDGKAFESLAQSGRASLLFVDDGSSDRTASMLTDLASRSSAIDVLPLPSNQGKAEAVRLGLRAAMEAGAPIVGYCDADLATPPDELVRLLGALEGNPEISVVFGSRIARMGSAIDRSGRRHYLGRVFASVASWSLRITVYDTQCGAKFFRHLPVLDAALTEPFPSSWGFDVRLLSRMLRGTPDIPGLSESEFLEVPLRTWRDVEGSKVDLRGSAYALVDIVRLRFEHRR